MRTESPAVNAAATAIRDELTGMFFADSTDLARAAIDAFVASHAGGNELLARGEKLARYLESSGDRESAGMISLLVVECQRLREIVRVNGLRFGATHEEIDDLLAKP